MLFAMTRSIPPTFQRLPRKQMRKGVVGHLYRPIKRPVTMRLDADVLAWLKQGGPGYQTKANRLLRREMLKSRRA